MRIVPAGLLRSAVRAAISASIWSRAGSQVAKQLFTRIRERQAARRSRDQPQSKPFLQHADVVTQRGLREAELCRSAGEASLFSHRDERGEVAEVALAHISVSFLSSLDADFYHTAADRERRLNVRSGGAATIG